MKTAGQTTDAAVPSGLDLSYVDAATRPQDDLFGHVNGRWLADYSIPADRATDGAFRSLFDRAEEQVRDLITEASASGAAEGTDQQRIGDLYASFLDEATVQSRGVRPLLDELATIDGGFHGGIDSGINGSIDGNIDSGINGSFHSSFGEDGCSKLQGRRDPGRR